MYVQGHMWLLIRKIHTISKATADAVSRIESECECEFGECDCGEWDCDERVHVYVHS